MHIVVAPVLGIIFNVLLQCVEANLTLGFKVTKISAKNKPANCNVANTTYAHGETFKLDCKTQCVCENGRHACSSLCPKEQLPAPEDTISCRSPRLVEVPGHCCKMWLCENPTADVYATCHNSSTSPWTPCSRLCGLGISTRFTTTTAGCNQLSNLRLCENRKCDTTQDNIRYEPEEGDEDEVREEVEQSYEENNHNHKYLTKTKQIIKNKLKRQQEHHQQHKHVKYRQGHAEHEHRIRKGHECRSIQRLGPARIRLGQCVSKKLYRPKICGSCHHNTKCCVPSVSTTIQVELLCPLNAMDPISFVQQQLSTGYQQQQQQQHQQEFYSTSSLTSLWDTQSLDAIDQEYLQSHQIQIENKFIAVEWILKCECTKNDNCHRIVNSTIKGDDSRSGNKHGRQDNIDENENDNENFNNKNMQNNNYFKFNHDGDDGDKYNNRNNNYNDYEQQQQHQQQQHHERQEQQQQHIDNNTPDDAYNNNDNSDDDADNDSDININNINNNNHKKQTKDYVEHNTNNAEQEEREAEEEWSNLSSALTGAVASSSSSSSSSGGSAATTSDEIQPDIIPYPPPPFSANKHTTTTTTSTTNNKNYNSNESNNNKANNKNSQTTKRIKGKFKLEHNSNNNNKQQLQQQYYEQWLLQQYHQPYQQQERLAT